MNADDCYAHQVRLHCRICDAEVVIECGGQAVGYLPVAWRLKEMRDGLHPVCPECADLIP